MATSKSNIVIDVVVDAADAQKSIGGLEDSIKDLKKLRDGKDIGSKAFNDLSAAIQKAEGKIKDVELEFESLDFEQKLTAGSDAVVGLAGGFAAAEGAAALFGAESEALEETLTKVAGALALSQGIRDLANGAIAMRKLGGAAKIARKAQIALNAAVKANPYVAAAAAIAAIIAVTVTLINKQKEYEDSIDVTIQKTKILNDSRLKSRKSIISETVELEALVSVAKDESVALEDRQEAIKQLNALSPQYLGDLTTQNILTDEGTTAIDNFTKALERRALAQALEEKLVELQRKRLDEIDRMTATSAEAGSQMGSGLLASLGALVTGGDIAKAGAEAQMKTAAAQKAANLEGIDTQIKATSDLLKLAKTEEVQADKTTRAYEHQVLEIDEAKKAREALKAEMQELNRIQAKENDDAIKLVQDKYSKILEEEQKGMRQIRTNAETDREQRRQDKLDGEELVRQDIKRLADFREQQRTKQLDNSQSLLDAVTKANDLFTSKEIKQLEAKQKRGEKLTKDELNMLGRAEKRKKDLAVAQIAIDTARGISAAVAAGAGLVFPANISAILSGVTAVLSGVAQAASILGTADSGISAESITSAATGAEGAQLNNISNTASLVDQDQQNLSQPVLVVESFNEVNNNLTEVSEAASF